LFPAKSSSKNLVISFVLIKKVYLLQQKIDSTHVLLGQEDQREPGPGEEDAHYSQRFCCLSLSIKDPLVK
jgi:hypothetical protein